MQPLKNYPGRKGGAGTWQQILAQIPKCETFIDAMCGSGLVGSKVTGCKVVFNDIDSTLVEKLGNGPGFHSMDYLDIVAWYGDKTTTVYYFDPPYLFETRSYQQNIYRYEWQNQDHEKFLEVVQKIQCPVLISHYPCEMYNTALAHWRKIHFQSMTRAGVRTECLYMNFSQPVLLQCPGVIGKNFTDRQRIKRKVESFISKLNRYPAQETAAILTTIINHFNYVTSKNSDQ